MAPDQLRQPRFQSGALHRVAGCHGRRLAGTAPQPRSHRRLGLAADPARGRSPLLLVGDLTEEPSCSNAVRFRVWATGAVCRDHRQSPRAQKADADRVILPAHDPPLPRACSEPAQETIMQTFENTVSIERPSGGLRVPRQLREHLDVELRDRRRLARRSRGLWRGDWIPPDPPRSGQERRGFRCHRLRASQPAGDSGADRTLPGNDQLPAGGADGATKLVNNVELNAPRPSEAPAPLATPRIKGQWRRTSKS